jgi:RNA polymerase sigma factor (sigma-70 family)
MHDIKKYRITIKIKNNILYSFIKEKNKTIAEFCRENNFSYQTVFRLLCFSGVYCKKNKNKFTPSAERIAKIFNVIPEVIFVDEFREIEKNSISIEANRDLIELGWYGNQKFINQFEDVELKSTIKKVLATLSEKERMVIEYRYGLYGDEYSISEISDILCVSKQRVKQIENKAIRRLRHPSRYKLLEQYLSM